MLEKPLSKRKNIPFRGYLAMILQARSHGICLLMIQSWRPLTTVCSSCSCLSKSYLIKVNICYLDLFNQ